MYLWQKRGGFFFQVRIPSNRVENLGRGHFRLWLGQIPKREAKRRALLLAALAFEGFESGMDRETLTKSLKALSDELEFLQKEERKATFARLAAVSRIDDAHNDAAEYGDEPDPSLIAYNGEKLASARAKEKTLASVRSRRDTIGQALQTDAAALTAERAAYAHALATVATIERAPVAVASLPIAPVVEKSEHEDERTVTADTLLSDAGKFYLALRKEAKEGAKGEDRYQERLESVLAAFIDDR